MRLILTDHYYEQGYSVRFSEIDTNTAELIRTYQNTVAERFMRIFGLEVNPSYIPYTSPADICKINRYGSVYFSNLHESCIHSPTHLERNVLRDALPNGTLNKSVIIWTGHILSGNPGSDSNATRLSIVITPAQMTTKSTNNSYTNKSAEEVLQESVFTLLHESSHQIGVPDHYCYGKGSSGECANAYCDECVYGYSEARDCLMGKRFNPLERSDETLYCSDCIDRILAHLIDHH